MQDLLRTLTAPDDLLPEDWFAHPPRLETPRLILRRAAMRDAQDVFAYASDPEVARYVLWEAHRTIGDSRHLLRCLLREYREGRPSNFVIEEKSSGHVIGTIGYMNWKPENASVEVGYSLARDCWGRGLATEALGAVLRHSFENLKVHRVEALHDVRNPASGRVMEKCGMKKEGVVRACARNKGEWVDAALWAILAEDWRE